MAGAAGAIESESPGPEDSWEARVTCGAEQSSSFSSYKEAAAPGAQGRPQVSAGGPQLPTDFCLPLLIAGVELPPGTHPQGRPPSTVHILEAVGSVCQESQRRGLLYSKPNRQSAAG